MSKRHVVRYRLDATFRGEESYDPAVPTSYQDALAKVDAIRQGIIKSGGKIEVDNTGPVQVREKAQQ